MLDFSREICILDLQEGILTPVSLNLGPNIHRPLLIGTTAVASKNSLIITGGSAVCFSFGTFWNNGCYTLSLPRQPESELVNSTETDITQHEAWKYSHTVVVTAPLGNSTAIPCTGSTEQVTLNIPKIHISSKEEFQTILKAGKPVVLEKLDIGSCVSKWTIDYLKSQVGATREVTTLTYY